MTRQCNCRDVRWCPGCPKDSLTFRVATDIGEVVAIVAFLLTLLFWTWLLGGGS